MRKFVWGTSLLLTVAALLLPRPAFAAGDGNGNTFNVRESVVQVVGKRCATVHYSVDGWSAGYDADRIFGSAFVTAGGRVEMYDWWDWEHDLYDANLSWRGTRRVCDRQDHTVTMKAEFDVYPDYDTCYECDEGYNTVVRDSYRVNYHPVKATAKNHGRRVKVKVLKDGKAWSGVRVRAAGITAKTNRYGTATFSKRAIPTGRKVAFKVGSDPAFARTTLRVTR